MRKSVLIFFVELDGLIALSARDAVQMILLSEAGIAAGRDIYANIVEKLLMIELRCHSITRGSVLEHDYS